MAKTLTKSDQYYTETKRDGEPWILVNSGPNEIYRITASRQLTTRRVKPTGIDLLFRGVGYSHSMVQTISPTVAFKSQTKINGLLYRGQRSAIYTNPAAAQVEFRRGYPFPYSVPPFEEPRSLSNNELRNLLGDQKLDLLTNLYEWRQTRDLFVGGVRPLLRETSEYAQDVRKMIRRYNRVGLGIPGSSLTKAIADLHLAYVFGVRPLVQDLTGAFELLTENEPAQVVKGRTTTGPKSAQLFAKSYPGVLYNPGEVAYVTRSGYARKRYIVYGELGPITSWRSYARLGINPLATAWEVLPWSFAIDRFIQVGDALQAMSALAGLKRSVAYETLKVEVVTQMTNLYGTATRLERITKRTLPSLSWQSPVVSNTFSDKQVPTYTALLRQQLSKLSPLFR